MSVGRIISAQIVQAIEPDSARRGDVHSGATGDTTSRGNCGRLPSLATQSAGVCMRRVMEVLVRQIEVPPTVTSVAEYPFTIKLP